MRRFGLLHRSKFYHPMTEMGQKPNLSTMDWSAPLMVDSFRLRF